MANNNTTDQPGSNDKRPHGEQTRNHEATATSGLRPNMEQERSNEDKSKQGPEEEHDPAINGKTNEELADERGGHGHGGHSGNRNGSRKR
ncbi:MAG: hypothetical protein JWP57_290 [Spirosoma sp.]|nr:hypothetical protein [Spirosoma sp.]